VATGDLSARFTAPEEGESSFGLQFNPILLWSISDRLQAHAEFEFRLEDSETVSELESANLAWLLNDHLTFRGGLFLTPLSTFTEQLHMGWVNKLPDKPIYATTDGVLVPESSLGAELLGGMRLEPAGRLTFAAYISNGPSLITSGAGAGQLDINNFEDLNDHKALGGRVGWLPIPELELAYAIQYADVAPEGSAAGDARLMTHVLSAWYALEHEAIAGRLEARAEFVLADYDGELDFGAGPFDNDRSGGYVQLAYRPTMASSLLADLEPVVRWDFLDQPGGAPRPADERRLTVGVNYWIAPSAVVKVAYRFDDVDDPSGQQRSSDALLVQFSMGF
jgi:hypothetical protein